MPYSNMLRPGAILWCVTGLLVPSISASFSGYIDGDNTTICSWNSPRAALIRDTIYLDGGETYWSTWQDDSWGAPELDDNRGGLVLELNLGESIGPQSDYAELLTKNKSTQAPGGRGNTAYPNYVDGAMLASNSSFYLYGGVADVRWEQESAPPNNSIAYYEIYQYGVERDSEPRSWSTRILSNNITNYVAWGGSASAPSEYKAWYFSGQRSPTDAAITKGPLTAEADEDGSWLPTAESTWLVTLDASRQNRPEWSKNSIDIEARASPEVVWVPVGEQGILVVLGGVVYPHWTTYEGTSRNATESARRSPSFMRTVGIYDVASQTWFNQTTTGGPNSTHTRGCAVVGTADDKSSYNIYYYGGFDGITQGEDFYDDVWVLSLPSFKWIHLNEGTAEHARAGHRCFTPYPDQMMVIGGYKPLPTECLEQLIVTFNMTSGEWMNSYDPTTYAAYGVPERVYSEIGGNAQGDAEETRPSDGWDDDDLADVFGTPYTPEIVTFYPYEPAASSAEDPGDSPGGDDDEDGGGGGGGLPSWVAPVLGVVLGLMALIAAAVIFFLWRKRKHLTKDKSEAGTEDARSRIRAWMFNTHTQKGAPTDASTDITRARALSPKESEQAAIVSITSASPEPSQYHQYNQYPFHNHYEMDNTQVMELDASAPVHRSELSNGPDAFTGAYEMHSPTRPSSNHRGGRSFTTSLKEADTGAPALAATAGPSQDDGVFGLDSPTIVTTPKEAAVTRRVQSEVSDITTTTHLRNLSDATVSSNGQTEVVPIAETIRGSAQTAMHIPIQNPPQPERTSAEAAISPPTAGDATGDDYVTAKSLPLSPQ